MHAALRAVLAIAIVAALAPQAIAQPRAKIDPDWPCQQIKTPTFSLASVWAGPQLDLELSELAQRKRRRGSRRPKWRSGAFRSPTWRRRSRTSRRRPAPTRTPSFCAPSPRRSRICRSNAPKSSTAWIDLAASRTRSPIVSARRTRRCKNLRTRTAPARRRPAPSSQDRLQWDIRVFDDRHQTVDLRLRGADADRTAYRGDRSRRAKGPGSVAAGFPPWRMRARLGSGPADQGEIGLSFSSSNGTP